ncbi:inorganic pyrophosphatase [[Candida] railenensis]|uniref:inorganic diphosphatase n=1 Tax=[Candida] railenensis TaxID=45579 RepID=A0A9P0QSA3_9ASCO|nr:inorganic pyrophosphatase [[Candida] railenensis]
MSSRLKLTNQHLQPNRLYSGGAVDAKSLGSVNQGAKYTTDFKNYATHNNKIVSYLHDIPLQFDLANKTANMVVEIPRWTNGKFEIDTKLPGNPIVQDVKKGKVRFVKNLFPNHGYIHNYGAFPQTWEDPTHLNEDLQLYGDNDPLDVCEIGSNVGKLGEVKTVKILGSLALIDDGELDWKIIAIDVTDPLSQELFDIHDVFVQCPGLLETTREWFRDYKIPDGKPKNKFAFNAVYKNQEETLEVVKECVEAWKRLVNGEVRSDKVELPSLENVTLEGSPGFVEKYDIIIDSGKVDMEEAELGVEVHKNHFNTQN